MPRWELVVESKYYTPTIEEFHVGFEYEVKWNEEKVIPYTFPNYPRAGIDWGSIRDKIAIIENLLSSKDKVKVKYLDREDIESLGFKFKENNESSYIKNNITIHVYNAKRWNTKHDVISIFRKDLERTSGKTIIFSGTIKNKS